jgi:hypothetical protein
VSLSLLSIRVSLYVEQTRGEEDEMKTASCKTAFSLASTQSRAVSFITLTVVNTLKKYGYGSLTYISLLVRVYPKFQWCFKRKNFE